MHPLERLWKKKERLVIGLMSGTSADGVDAALVRISGTGVGLSASLVEFLSVPFAPEVRKRVLEIAGGGRTDAAEICRFKTLLGILYAEACEALLKKAGAAAEEIDLVGCHGQTIWHIPDRENYLGRRFASTLQIGEDAVIAERLGCPVVGDFRVRDVAAGGQGAPLVPYTEFLLYREETKCTALQNLGGIGNVTILPAGCALSDVVAFDTGPGNMVIDALVSHFTQGRQTYDDGGRIALGARVSEALLNRMLDDEYLARPLPKTTGRERYGEAYVDALIRQAREENVSLPDVIATATRFTAECVRVGIERFSPEPPSRLVVGGGGSRNLAILAHLRALLPGCRVETCEERGFSSDAKEAVAFAILANEAAFGACNNVPAVTGARAPVVMGRLTI